MMILSSIPTIIYIYILIIVLLLILDIALTVISIKTHKRYKIKKDFLEIEEQSDEMPVSEEIMAIFKKMEEDSKLEPEEVVQKFEDEQEKNAIISYQELLNSVQNNQASITEDDNGDVDFVQQLQEELDVEPVVQVEEQEKKAENTIEIINKKDKNMDNTLEPLEEKEENDATHLDVVDELNDDNKFVHSEVVSPVFGRITDFTKYSLNKDNTVEIKQVAGTSPEEEIKKNEAFLKALIDFRNNL